MSLKNILKKERRDMCSISQCLLFQNSKFVYIFSVVGSCGLTNKVAYE